MRNNKCMGRRTLELLGKTWVWEWLIRNIQPQLTPLTVEMEREVLLAPPRNWNWRNLRSQIFFDEENTLSMGLAQQLGMMGRWDGLGPVEEERSPAQDNRKCILDLIGYITSPWWPSRGPQPTCSLPKASEAGNLSNVDPATPLPAFAQRVTIVLYQFIDNRSEYENVTTD